MKKHPFLFLYIPFVIIFGLNSSALAISEATGGKDLTSCTGASDCVVYKGCCSWRAVNAKYLAELQRRDAESCRLLECMFAGNQNKRPSAQCNNHECQLGK